MQVIANPAFYKSVKLVAALLPGPAPARLPPANSASPWSRPRPNRFMIEGEYQEACHFSFPISNFVLQYRCGVITPIKQLPDRSAATKWQSFPNNGKKINQTAKVMEISESNTAQITVARTIRGRVAEDRTGRVASTGRLLSLVGRRDAAFFCLKTCSPSRGQPDRPNFPRKFRDDKRR